jgi:hypothetical protein
VHLLLILGEEDKVFNTDHIDQIVSAEIPCPKNCPELFEIIMKYNIHTPCCFNNPYGLKMPCQDENGLCAKDFLKNFSEVNFFPIFSSKL